ncbi:hypothetical protein HZA38_01085 [Candidatus Peregrinibacteria bacterium]|nr:hypothetical protein [Candidatus Peregrinibacteria bacterium]
MKPFLSASLLGALLIFAGCGGGSPEYQIPGDTELESISLQGISLKKPPSWELIDRTDRPDAIPSDVILLMRSVEPWGAQLNFALVGVGKEKLPENTSSIQYAKAAVQKTEQEIVNYESVSEEDIDIQGNKAIFLQFRGKESLSGDVREWFHLFVAKNDMGYVVSAVTPLDAEANQKEFIKSIVKSFAFREAS